MRELDHKESWVPKNWCFWTVVLEKTLESPLDCKEIQQSILRRLVLTVHWKDWYWSSNTLSTWCEELTHWKRPWCWERLKAGGEGDNRGWDGWMASLTWWAWVWAISGSWQWTGKPGMLQSMGLQRVGHDWATELNWPLSRHLFSYGLGSLGCRFCFESASVEEKGRKQDWVEGEAELWGRPYNLSHKDLGNYNGFWVVPHHIEMAKASSLKRFWAVHFYFCYTCLSVSLSVTLF